MEFIIQIIVNRYEYLLWLRVVLDILFVVYLIFREFYEVDIIIMFILNYFYINYRYFYMSGLKL